MSLLLLRAQNCQHSSKAEHVTPETCVLHGIKVLSKALYSWEILFIINIYVTTPSWAKHVYIPPVCFFKRQCWPDVFARALQLGLCLQLFSISPCNVSKSLRGQMLPHIHLFTKEHGCILLFLRVCIREKWQRACGVTESSYLLPPKEYGFGVEKRSEDLWGTMPKIVSHPKRSQLFGAWCKVNQWPWLGERLDFCLTR